MTLPTDIVAGDFGHISHHNDLHEHYDDLAPGPWHAATNIAYDNGVSGLAADQVQEAIDEIIAIGISDETIGTWAAMNASSPVDGQRWYASDQHIPYRYDASLTQWRRMIGDPDEIWVTDFGALPDDNIASAGTNVTAFNAAFAAARANIVSLGGYNQKAYTVVVPGTAVGQIYYVNATLNIEQIHLKGNGNGIGNTNFGGWSYKVMIKGDSIASPNPTLVLDRTISGTATMNATVVENLNITGNCVAIKALAASGDNAGLTLLNVDLYANSVAHADNSCVLLAGFFWFNWFMGAGRIGSSGTGKPSVLMRSIDTSTDQVYLCQFRDLIFTFGGFEYSFERTLAGGPIGGRIDIHNVTTEQQNPTAAFFKVSGSAGAIASQTLENISITTCLRDDDGGSGGSFMEIAPQVAIIVKDLLLMHNTCSTNYVVKASNTSIERLRAFGNTGVANAEFFDPTGTSWGVNSSDVLHFKSLDHFDAQTYHNDQATSSGGERYFRGASALYAWLGIDSAGRALKFGSDTTAEDMKLSRPSAGRFEIRSTDASPMNLDVDNSDAAQATAVNWKLNGSQKWAAYVPGSSTELRFYAAGDKIVFEAGGRIKAFASTTATAGLRLPHGAAPSAPADGDIWTTTAGLFVHINGVTVGPLS